MNITIFKDLTTSDYLKELQVESEKYTGLYVDMNNAPERKYVKDKAYDIQQLLKKLNRARIDKSAAYKSQVEKEAASIVEQLETANLPFMSLINEYKAERAEILAGEKAANDLRVFLAQKEDDHEMALLINKTYEYDKAEEKRAQEKQEQIAAEEFEAQKVEAEKKAAANQILINEAIERDKVHAENARLANKEYCARVNRTALADLLEQTDLTHVQAKQVVQAIARNRIANLTINY